jgi:hypothetical protein
LEIEEEEDAQRVVCSPPNQHDTSPIGWKESRSSSMPGPPIFAANDHPRASVNTTPPSPLTTT